MNHKDVAERRHATVSEAQRALERERERDLFSACCLALGALAALRREHPGTETVATMMCSLMRIERGAVL